MQPASSKHIKKYLRDPVLIYTDGACSGNPGPAGIGVVLEYQGRKKEISEHIGYATNNIAELKVVRTALLTLKRKDLPVQLHTDSSYVHGLLTKGWRATRNTELVGSIRKLIKEFSSLKIIKVRGHSGIKGNELADKLATRAVSKNRRSSEATQASGQIRAGHTG